MPLEAFLFLFHGYMRLLPEALLAIYLSVKKVVNAFVGLYSHASGTVYVMVLDNANKPPNETSVIEVYISVLQEYPKIVNIFSML